MIFWKLSLVNRNIDTYRKFDSTCPSLFNTHDSHTATDQKFYAHFKLCRKLRKTFGSSIFQTSPSFGRGTKFVFATSVVWKRYWEHIRRLSKTKWNADFVYIFNRYIFLIYSQFRVYEFFFVGRRDIMSSRQVQMFCRSIVILATSRIIVHADGRRGGEKRKTISLPCNFLPSSKSTGDGLEKGPFAHSFVVFKFATQFVILQHVCNWKCK